MGQKVHPVGFRLGVVETWASSWYARGKTYAEYLHADLRVRASLAESFASAGLSRVDIKRTANNKMEVDIYSSRPGIIIGKKGSGADALKKKLAKLGKGSTEPVLNVYEVKRPDLDANIIADSIRQQLERRVSFRRAMKKAIPQVMKAGAKGVKIQCSGRLGGADMSRIEQYREGRVPLHTMRADISYGTREAKTTYGLIGIKVWIFTKEVLDRGHVRQRGRNASA